MQIKLFGYEISVKKSSVQESSVQESSGQTYIAICDPELKIVKRVKAYTQNIEYHLLFLQQKYESFKLSDEQAAAGYTFQKVTFERMDE